MKESSFSIEVDQITIRGRCFSDSIPKPKPCVILLHGIPRDKSSVRDESYVNLARRLAEKGWLAIFFNFRGTGESGGNFHILGWNRDLAAVVNWAAARPESDPERIAVVGFSGGAATAIYTAAQNERIKTVVALSSPAEFNFIDLNIKEWIDKFKEIGMIRDNNFPPSLQQWENEFHEISPIKWVDRISPRPILFIHGIEDEVVPVEHARLLFKKARDPKEIALIEGGHRLKHSQLAIDKAMAWLEAWCR